MVERRKFMFALRDWLPLDEQGWNIALHNERCVMPCGAGAACAGTLVRLVQHPTQDGSPWKDATETLLGMVARRVGGPVDAPPNMLVPGLASFAEVSVPADGEGEFERAFSALAQAVDALRIATDTSVSPLTIERIWPMYAVLNASDSEHVELIGMPMVEHVRPWQSRRPATPEQLKAAEQVFAGVWNGDPVVNIRYWLRGARNDAHVNGDYPGAVLKAATAAEVLIKSTAAYLIWEHTSRATGTPQQWCKLGPKVLGKNPLPVIEQVLEPALGGSWSRDNAVSPVGGWRAKAAVLRNDVIHTGYRPTAEQVDEAIAAVLRLVEHVNDRLAARAQDFPRTAVIVAGRSGLERRGAWGKVRATHATETDDWRAAYRSWVAGAGSASHGEDIGD